MLIHLGWHRRMPFLKTFGVEQKIRWYIAHRAVCSCRSIPVRIRKEMRKRKIAC